MTQEPPDPDDPSPPAPSPETPSPEAGSPQALQPEAPSPVGASSDPVQILVTALARLPADDRDQVYIWLLRQRAGLGPTSGEPELPLRPPSARVARSLTESLLNESFLAQSVRSTVASGQQMVPVRFSSEQHAQLRAWCAEHGFSMATVIRGLVARFLESQMPTSDEGGR